jgi:hypothetical protein
MIRFIVQVSNVNNSSRAQELTRLSEEGRIENRLVPELVRKKELAF